MFKKKISNIVLSFFFPSVVFAVPLLLPVPSDPTGTTGAIVPAIPMEQVIPFSSRSPDSFSVDGRLQKNVQFWVKIYTQYTAEEGLIHDAKYIDHVYEVIDFRNSAEKNSRIVRREKKKWKDMLLAIHRKRKTPDQLSQEEKRIFDMFSDVQEPNKFLNAAHRKRLRFQLGQKDHFIRGIEQSGKYLTHMEEIFRKESLPVELTRLPFVESSFNIRARSKVGASGVWQFMRSTAKLFIHVNDAIDERNDPLRATEAAAKLLRLNYESLRNWPLAVTAYNHGRKGMMRAVRRVGTDELEVLVADYRSRTFGFASGNFFTELLAAIEVEKNAEKYFGKVNRGQPLGFIEVKVPDFIAFADLLKNTGFEEGSVKELNPSLSEGVLRGGLLIPSRYLLRLPLASGIQKEAALKTFWEAYARIPQTLKLKRQRSSKYGTREGSVNRHFKNRT